MRIVLILALVGNCSWVPSVSAAAPGHIITVAGGGAGDGELAVQVAINEPKSVAVDSAGNLYIADEDVQRIRKVAADTGTISTVAGFGAIGRSGDNIPATTALLENPSHVVLDNAGNMFFVDSYNRCVWKVKIQTGIITTAANIQSTALEGIAVDSAGNLFVADSAGHRIWKVAAGTQVATTVAGTGTAGFNGDNIASASAQLDHPTGVAVDIAGNLFIVDSWNNRIRKLEAATGIISTVAGTAPGGYNGDSILAINALLSRPSGVYVAGNGDLLIADTLNHRIRKVAAETGIITTVAGNGVYGYNGDGVAAISAQLFSPVGVVLDATDNLLIADTRNHRIRKVAAATGVITTVAGNGAIRYVGDNLPAIQAALYRPSDVAIDRFGNVAVVDHQGHRIRKIASGTGIIVTVAGNGNLNTYKDNVAATETTLAFPNGVAFDHADNLYIADTAYQRIRKVAAGTGIITAVAGNGTEGYNGDGIAATNANLSRPEDLVFDSAGLMYIADKFNSRVRKVDPGTGLITTAVGDGTTEQLYGPSSLAFDGAGNLFIVDQWNNRIRKMSVGTGIITTVAGNGTPGFNGDNILATSAQLRYPQGVAVDRAGNLFIADSNNHRIRKVAAATGIITTIAGHGIAGYNGDNIAAANAQLNLPVKITFDAAGNLFIADRENNRVRMILAAGSFPDAGIGPSPAPGNISITVAWPDRGEQIQLVPTLGATADVTAKIYDRRGLLVKEINTALNPGESLPWNCRNSSGEIVAPGVYMAILSGGANEKIKVVVRR
jgi:sugar lactone lactonase YvrE